MNHIYMPVTRKPNRVIEFVKDVNAYEVIGLLIWVGVCTLASLI